jgi:hypothetical protein
MMGLSIPLRAMRIGTTGMAPARPPAIPVPLVTPRVALPAQPGTPVVAELPGAVRITVEAVDVDVAEVLHGIAGATNTVIRVAPGISGRVTVTLRNVTAEEAVQAIMYRTGLAMVRSVQDGRSVMDVTAWHPGPSK